MKSNLIWVIVGNTGFVNEIFKSCDLSFMILWQKILQTTIYRFKAGAIMGRDNGKTNRDFRGNLSQKHYLPLSCILSSHDFIDIYTAYSHNPFFIPSIPNNCVQSGTY